MQVRKRRLILCGDWNINFIQEGKRLHDMQELSSLHNLVHTVRSPARVTKNMASLTDVDITNKDSTSDIATVMDLEYSDHKAQLLSFNVKKKMVKNGR